MKFRLGTLATATIFAGAMLSSALSSHAATYSLQFDQIGSDVVVTGSGAIDLTGATLLGNGNIVGFMWPSLGFAMVAGGSFSAYRLTMNPTNLDFGLGGYSGQQTSGSGDASGVWTNNNIFYVPTGYTSLAALFGTSTYAGQTFASLGVTPGNYDLNFGNNTVSVQVGPVPIPLPLTLLLTGILGLGILARRRVNPAV